MPKMRLQLGFRPTPAGAAHRFADMLRGREEKGEGIRKGGEGGKRTVGEGRDGMGEEGP